MSVPPTIPFTEGPPPRLSKATVWWPNEAKQRWVRMRTPNERKHWRWLRETFNHGPYGLGGQPHPPEQPCEFCLSRTPGSGVPEKPVPERPASEPTPLVDWRLGEPERAALEAVLRTEPGTARAFVAARMLAGLAFWCTNCHANADLWRARHPGEDPWDHADEANAFAELPDSNLCPDEIEAGGCRLVCMPQGTCDHMKNAAGEYLN